MRHDCPALEEVLSGLETCGYGRTNERRVTGGTHMMLVVSPVRHTLQSGLCGRYDLCFGSCLATLSQPFQVLKGHMSRVMRPVKALMAVGVDRLGWWHSFKRDSPGITQDVWALWKGICIQAVFHKAFDSSKSEISGEQQGVVRGQFCWKSLRPPERWECSHSLGTCVGSFHYQVFFWERPLRLLDS